MFPLKEWQLKYLTSLTKQATPQISFTSQNWFFINMLKHTRQQTGIKAGDNTYLNENFKSNLFPTAIIHTQHSSAQLSGTSLPAAAAPPLLFSQSDFSRSSDTLNKVLPLFYSTCIFQNCLCPLLT